MNWKGCGSVHGLIIRYCPGICLEGLRKATKNLSQDSRYLSQDLSLGPPEYEARVFVTTRPWRLVSMYVVTCHTENMLCYSVFLFWKYTSIFKYKPHFLHEDKGHRLCLQYSPRLFTVKCWQKMHFNFLRLLIDMIWVHYRLIFAMSIHSCIIMSVNVTEWMKQYKRTRQKMFRR
jgi:hypothetical protein